MDKDIFLRGYAGLAVFTGVEVSETALKAAFNLMKDDFGNEEFLRICEDIAKTENLYGRLPIPKLFYDRRKKSAPVSPSKFQMAKMFFWTNARVISIRITSRIGKKRIFRRI